MMMITITIITIRREFGDSAVKGSCRSDGADGEGNQLGGSSVTACETWTRTKPFSDLTVAKLKRLRLFIALGTRVLSLGLTKIKRVLISFSFGQ